MNRTRRILVLLVSAAGLLLVGYLAGRSGRSRASVSAGPSGASGAAPKRRVLYWYDPMKPELHFDHPGKSPLMDMDLLPKYADESAPAAAPVTGRAPVAIPEARMQEIGVTTAVIGRRELSGDIVTNGTIAEDESLRFDVNVKFSGYIRRLYVTRTGDFVRKGEPLFSVYSPDLVATEREYLLALDNERALAGGGDPAARRDAERLTQASRDRLALWDVPAPEIARIARTREVSRELTIVSPASGTVLAKNAVEGMAVAPGATLFSVANLARVWILADIYQRELPRVARGDAARVSLAYLPGRTFSGSVDFLYPTLNPETRTVRVRIAVPNPDGSLRPGMFATVAIRGRTRNVLAVPRDAVLDTGKRSLAYVETAPGRFEPREIELGERTARFAEVLGGLREGDRVATSALFLIDSESRIDAVGPKVTP